MMIMQDGSKRFVLTLLSAVVLSQPAAMAAELSKWNPANWFGAPAASDDSRAEEIHLEEARRRAEEARKKAEEALIKAAEAKAALEAAQQAMQSKSETDATNHRPVVEFPIFNQKPADEAANDAEIFSTPAVQEKPGESGGSRWNPLTWLKQEFQPEPETLEKAEPKPARLAPLQPEAATEQDAVPAATGKAAILETERGNIAIELFPEEAPLTVTNFVNLTEAGFYNKFNMKFHRVIPGFVIQTGDPTGTGAGGSQKRIPLEVKNKLSHNAKGMVAMARGPDPNSASSQFYITLAPQANLDGKYAVFGRVIAGMDVLDKIEKNDMLYGIKIVDIDSVVRDPEPDKKGMFSKLF